MSSTQAEPPSKQGAYVPLLILLGYDIVFHFVFWRLFPQIRLWELWITAGFTGLMTVVCLKNSSERLIAVGFRSASLKRQLLFGCLGGALVTGTPPLLDFLINSTALAKEALFTGAEGRVLEKPPLTFAIVFKTMVLLPLVSQVLLIGLCLQPLYGKLRPQSLVLISAVLFPLTFWEFSLGAMLIGGISVGYFYLTRSLWAGILFHSFCGLGGLLLAYVYPKGVTLLGILL